MTLVEQLEGAGEVLSPAVRAALVALEARVHALEALEAEVVRLRAEVAELKARLGQNSTNSSLPPSSDPPGLAHPAAPKRGGRRGGQRGHPGSFRSLLPPERVDRRLDYRPERCRHCGASLAEAREVGAARVWQTIELPPLVAEVTEHRCPTLVCRACGRPNRAALPREVAGHQFGPRLVGLSLLLLARFRLSRRALAELLSDLLDVPAPALGTTERFCDEARSALHAPWREVGRAVRRSALAHVDETGWALRERLRWLWVATTPAATLFRLETGRGGRQRERLLGRHFGGVITTDRWRAYDPHPLLRRQLCWAHLKRNFQGLVDRGGAAASVGHRGLAATERVFALAARWRERAPPDPEAARELQPLERYTRRLLRKGERSSDPKARALCRDLLRLWPALWTFARAEGRRLAVPVTNNAAERALRAPVLWRKNCFFSQSGRGLRFVERMLTVTATCRQQQKSPLEFLTQAIVAHRLHRPAPRLLPSR